MWSHSIYVHCAEKVLQTMDLAPFVLVNGNINIYTDLCMFQVFEFRYIISPTHFFSLSPSHTLYIIHLQHTNTHTLTHTLTHSITHTHSLNSPEEDIVDHNLVRFDPHLSTLSLLLNIYHQLQTSYCVEREGRGGREGGREEGGREGGSVGESE